MISEAQTGFRKGYSTIGHIFVLKGIIDLFIWRRKKNYFLCLWSQSFCMALRVQLWYELIRHGVKGKFMKLMKKKTRKIILKKCIIVKNEAFDYSVRHRGVSQEENMSPLLFAMYVNDLEEYFPN